MAVLRDMLWVVRECIEGGSEEIYRILIMLHVED